MYDTYLYFLKEMEKKPNSIHMMGNHELADYCYPRIKEKHPDAVLIKTDRMQYFALNDKAKRKLKKKLEGFKRELNAELLALEESIASLEV